MASVFLDTSALLRRYFTAEPGANRVRILCEPSQGHTIAVSRLAALELASGLGRRVRERTLPERERRRRWDTFVIDLRDQYRVVQITEAVYATAQRLVSAYPLRTLDAIQLASALVVRERLRDLVFWTADDQQATAARREGLAVEHM